MKPAAEAAAQGYGQVLWMLGDDITEVGAMNVFFLIQEDEGEGKRKILVTPPLSRGDILPGVTRRSIMELASSWSDVIVQERNITLTEVTEAAKKNQILEVFGAGTAAVVTPICGINDITIDAPGEFTQRVWKELIDIQYGRKIHPDSWSVEV
jgi:branched-chain amino acid aminotransferase